MNAVGTIADHERRQMSHDRFGLDMEVVQHGVAIPPTDEADGEAVNFANIKGHGARRPKATGGHVFRVQAEARTQECDCVFYGGGEVSRR